MSELQDRIHSISQSIDQIVEASKDLGEEILRFKPTDALCGCSAYSSRGNSPFPSAYPLNHLSGI